MTAPNIHATLDTLRVPVSGLKHYGKNPRRGDVDKIAKSLTDNGQYKAIVVRTGTMEVLAGNHTLKAARKLGWDEIAATFVTVDDTAAARIVLVDNRMSDFGAYDAAEHLELVKGLSPADQEKAGYTAADVDAMVYGVEQEPAEAPAEADELPAAYRPVSKLGDVFELGEHRVICGDATSAPVLEALLGAERPDLMWTDPPYGVDYVGKTKDALRIENDGAAGLDPLLRAAFAAAAAIMRPGAPVYVAHADTERVTFENTLRAAGFLIRQNLIWVKNTMVLGHSDYHYKHEPILAAEAAAEEEPAEAEGKGHEPLLYGFTPGGAGRLGRGGPRWYGPNNRTTVFEFPKPPANREHPTMKPVDLILAMLANSVRPGGIVFDPFAGSGSTLIAAHYHGARARVVELDPKYVDVICARYQKLTGELPTLDGEPTDFLPASEE